MNVKKITLWAMVGFCGLLSTLALAAPESTTPEPGVATSQLLTVLAGLAFVLLLVFGCGWFVKRFSGMAGKSGGAIKVVSVLPVGTRERLALVEVGGQQLLIGVTAQQISTLHTFDEPVVDATDLKNNSEFAQKLHQMMSRS